MKSDFLASVRTAVAVLTLLALPARAGGPIGLCDTGAPMLWPGGGVSIPFNPDLGNLGPSLDNAAAVALVQSSFDVWGDLPSSTASYLNAGPLPEDVDINNFGPYLSPGAPDGYSAIVFDDTGEIFDLVFGAGSGILGFAGPEWIDFTTCTILEGVSFLNGPAFTDPVYAFDVMVHEFGHYSGLAHTVVNGQIYLVGDATGPAPDNATFGFAPDPFAEDVLETMYPYYFGPGIGTGSPERDDIASLSTLYPEPGFATTTGTLTGVIYAPDGVTPLTGVNVIARNLADPFNDAVSAISGDYSYFYGDAFTGHFTLRGLTPGASYAVYIDQIVAGGFSAPVISLPGVEEFYNGVNESNNLITTDTPSDYTAVSAAAGATTAGVNIIINGVKPGDPLPVGDEGSYELFLPFPFTIVGQTYHSVFVNANGNLTFGAAAPFPDYFPDAYGLLNGPPRIAGLWADLDASAGGVVTFGQTATTFTVYWKNVPSYFIGGDNTFSITLRKTGNVVEVKYGSLTATDGVAGLSGGFATTSGLETPIDLTPAALKKTRLSLWLQPAIFEVFDAGNPFDLAGKTSFYQHDYDYNDKWAGANNSFATAKPISLPFDSSAIKYYTEIAPTGADVDFFKFEAPAGYRIRVYLTRGAFDSVAGIFAPDGTLVAVDDDSGPDLLSWVEYVVPVSGTYTVGISAYADFDFTGAGGSGGRYIAQIDLIEADSDYDGIGDLVDNCPYVWNPGQEDSNGNGVGDACEPPPNDDFANAVALTPTDLPYTDALSNGGATSEPAEPFPPCVFVGHSVWYSVTAATDTLIEVNTLGTFSFYSALAAYTGTSLDDLNAIACNYLAFDTAAQIVFPVAAGQTVFIQAGGYYDGYYGDLVVNILERLPPPVDSHEPNNSAAEATPVTCGETISDATIGFGDVDFYRIELEAGAILVVDVDSTDLTLNSMLGVFDSDGNFWAFSDDQIAPGETSTLDPYLEFVVPVAGTYYIAVTSAYDYDFNGGSDHLTYGSYVMNLECLPPCATEPTEGPNGHHYLVVNSYGITWEDAKIAAEGMIFGAFTGHLATVTSYEEDAFINQLRRSCQLQQLWIGGLQPADELIPTDNWTWFNGEGAISGVNGGPTYSNWRFGEPNDAGGPGTEQHLAVGLFGEFVWNDEFNPSGGIYGFVVEFETAGPP